MKINNVRLGFHTETIYRTPSYSSTENDIKFISSTINNCNLDRKTVR